MSGLSIVETVEGFPDSEERPEDEGEGDGCLGVDGLDHLGRVFQSLKFLPGFFYRNFSTGIFYRNFLIQSPVYQEGLLRGEGTVFEGDGSVVTEVVDPGGLSTSFTPKCLKS